MANTLGGINLAQIADETLTYLGHSFHPISAFTTDFGTDIKEKGESVTTRIVSSLAASDLSSGYTPSDVTSTAVTVTLNQFFGTVFAFTDLEMSKAGDVNWLRNQFMEPAVEGLLDKIFSTVFALVTNSNYSNNSVITAANFDADDLADLGGDLSTLKVPKSGRAAILNPSYIASLAKDSVVEDASAFGDNVAIREGRVPRVRGFNTYEFTNIPANGENLEGFVAHPCAIALAARTVVDPTEIDGNAPLAVENRTDPASGLPLQFRAWYDPDNGKLKISMGTLWGVSKGQGNGLKRILSA